MDVLLDEVESLEAILMDDVKIVRNESGIPELIETTVLPTVGEDTDRQYVCITLQVIPTADYPDAKPKFHLKNPRGLDDQNINQIRVAVEQKLSESIGLPVVFDLIEVIRELLTNSNLPTGQCVICLYGFQEGDEFTKTVCYHYLHSYCLARHLMASKKNYQEEQDKLPAWQQKLSPSFQLSCPVCREPIDQDAEPLRQAKAPIELKNAPKFELTTELKGLQTRMSNLFKRQKIRGGIIDLDAEETNVLSIETEADRLKRLQQEDAKNQEATLVATNVPLSPVKSSPEQSPEHHYYPNKNDPSNKYNNNGRNSNQQPKVDTQTEEKKETEDDDESPERNNGRNHYHGRHHRHHGGGNRYNRRFHHNHDAQPKSSKAAATSSSAASNNAQKSQPCNSNTR